MSRGAWVAVTLAAALLALVGLRSAALARAEQALRSRGLTYEEREGGVLGWTWYGLSGLGITADRFDLDLHLPLRVRLTGVVVDLAVLDRPGAAAGDDASPNLPLQVDVVGLHLRYGALDVARDLAGSLSPALHLTSADGDVQRVEGRLALVLRRNLDQGLVRGPVVVTVREDEPGLLELQVRSAGIGVSHPLLSRAALPELPLSVGGTWSRADGELQLAGTLGGVAFLVSGVARSGSESPRFDLMLSVPDTALGEAVALLGDQVPEARRAVLTGTVGLEVDARGPPWTFAVRPRATGLGAEGLLSDPEGLQSGRITWRVQDEEGNAVLRSTNDRPTTTALTAPRLAAAVVAAEDGGFLTHPGYDLDAISEAVRQWSAAPEGREEDQLRGASTLTQQLAKNLFLDGERTLARKVRELLYAVELERVLGKRGVLDLYLNVVELGPGIYGMAEGADTYFLKQPGGLNWREAAYLAAILPAPRTFHAMAARGREPGHRVDQVLVHLLDARRISAEEAKVARSHPVRFLLPVAGNGRSNGSPG